MGNENRRSSHSSRTIEVLFLVAVGIHPPAPLHHKAGQLLTLGAVRRRLLSLLSAQEHFFQDGHMVLLPQKPF